MLEHVPVGRVLRREPTPEPLPITKTFLEGKVG